MRNGSWAQKALIALSALDVATGFYPGTTYYVLGFVIAVLPRNKVEFSLGRFDITVIPE
jgi:hypothetical protein